MTPTVRAHGLRSAVKPKQNQQRPSRTRAAQKHVSYREDSSDTGESTNDSSSSDDNAAAISSSPALRKTTSTTGTRKRKTPKSCMQPVASLKKRKTDNDHNPVKCVEDGSTPIQTTGKAMPWATLPYQILATIFDHASRPLVSDTFEARPSIGWLLDVSLLCKAFAEPALSALYYSPPLNPPYRAYALVEHLASQGDHSTYNYRAKVKYLDVEAQHTLMHKFAGRDPIDLGYLVSLAPQLRGISIHLLSDNPKFRRAMMGRAVTGKIVYEPSLFKALEDRHIVLRQWIWNQSLGSHSHRLINLKEPHAILPFRTLRDISFVNYQGSTAAKPSRREELLAEAINLLPNLTSLHFRMSPIVNSHLMPRLPNSLQKLEIVDCKTLTSPSLSFYLSTSGASLRQLILDHNQSLNLSFMTTLGTDCPLLEVLQMDLRYYNTFLTVRDSEPKYHSLFGKHETVLWPASLQRLELFHLRKWNLGQAEIFFSTLVGAARSLSQLRQLRIKASLEESGWRERVAFRDKWTKNLQLVFQRKSAPPDPHLYSMSAYQAFRKQQSQARYRLSRLDRVDIPRSNGKPFENIKDSSSTGLPNEVHSESDSDVPLSNVRRSTRVKAYQDPKTTLSSSTSISVSKPRRRRRKRQRGSNASSSEDSALEDENLSPTQSSAGVQNIEGLYYVQGMCDVVDVLIDNLRPTEEHLNENDFLDNEVSGDESWNGEDDDMDGGGGYAW